MNTDLELRGPQLDSLLNDGQYAHLAEFLFDLQTNVEQTEQSDLKNLTATALQICLFCQQCQTEMEWHQKADRQVRLRLVELKRQLDTLLNLIVEYESQNTRQHPTISVSVTLLDNQHRLGSLERPNIWERIRNLFNVNLKPLDSVRQVVKVVVNTRFSSTVEKDQRLVQPDSQDDMMLIMPTMENEAIAHLNTNKLNVSKTTTKGQENLDDVMPPKDDLPDLKKDGNSAAPNPITAQNQDTPPSLIVYCLGIFRVYLNDQLVREWPSSKGKSILKYLVAQRNQPIPKEVLMELFWPGAHPDAARNNLNVSIYGLRQALRNISPDYSHILFQEECYLLNPVMELWIDFEEFTNRIQIGRQKEERGEISAFVQEYQAAEALYQGEFLKEDRYEDWLIPQRQNLQNEYLKLLDRLSRYYIDQNDFAACLTVCAKMLAVDPCREEAHRRLMRCYYCQGQPYLALRQYHMCGEALREELDLAPSEATENLYQRIRMGEIV